MNMIARTTLHLYKKLEMIPLETHDTIQVLNKHLDVPQIAVGLNIVGTITDSDRWQKGLDNHDFSIMHGFYLIFFFLIFSGNDDGWIIVLGIMTEIANMVEFHFQLSCPRTILTIRLHDVWAEKAINSILVIVLPNFSNTWEIFR